MDLRYSALTPKRLTATNGSHQPQSAAEYDGRGLLALVSVEPRGQRDEGLAEYIVAKALALGAGVRRAWDAYDLRTASNEVKCAAYLQAWAHRKSSTIRFRIRSTRRWDGKTGSTAEVLGRQADAYVLYLRKHYDKPTVYPLNLGSMGVLCGFDCLAKLAVLYPERDWPDA